MSRFLIDKYKGKYRILCPIDPVTNDFIRECDGSYSTEDLYIKCANKVQVFHYGGSILECYVPSLGRGRNMVKAIKEQYPNILISVVESDSEVIFRFKNEYMDQLAPIIKPSTSGARISPFSSKNRKKNKYIIPEEDINRYKSVVNVGKENMRLHIELMHGFIQFKYKSIKAQERIKKTIIASGLKTKEWIHSQGLWDDYIKYCQTEIAKNE